MVPDYEILTILMVLFSTQIVKLSVQTSHMRKNDNSPAKWLAWIFYMAFQYWVMKSNAIFPLLVLLTNIVLISLVYRTSLHVQRKTALFHAAVFYSIWMLVEIAINNLMQLTGMKAHTYYFLVGSAVSKIVMYLALHMVNHYRKSNSFKDIPFHYWIRLSLIPIATIYIIHNTYRLTSFGHNTTFFTITTVLMILVNFISFDMYDKLGNYMDAEKRNLAYEQQIALCNKQAAEREAAYQTTRRIRHDLNDYLIDLKAALEAGMIAEAKTKIDHILAQNRLYKNEISRSGNLVIDSLINYKYSLAKKCQIDMKCYVFIPEQLPFEGADLCIILGNLLDNAIEAVSFLPKKQQYIDVSVSEIKENLSITVRNPYEGEIKENRSGQILTGKPDKQNHGIGLSSVRRTIDKYNGELLIDYENHIFQATVLLYPPEKLHEEP